MYLPEDEKLLTIVSLNLHEQNQREDQLGKESLEKLFYEVGSDAVIS